MVGREEQGIRRTVATPIWAGRPEGNQSSPRKGCGSRPIAYPRLLLEPREKGIVALQRRGVAENRERLAGCPARMDLRQTLFSIPVRDHLFSRTLNFALCQEGQLSQTLE